jgi:hypothetical protein
MRREQRRAKRKAKALRDAGDYAAAQAEYESALQSTRQLDRLEAEESVLYDFEADAIEGELREVQREAAARASLESSSQPTVDDGEYDLLTASSRSPSIDDLGSPVQHGPIVPLTGAIVRYQMLLLAPDDARAIPIRARRPVVPAHRPKE